LTSDLNSISHETLIKILSTKIQNKPELNLIKKAIENPTVSPDYRKITLREIKNKKGVPQGLAISNILANIYLHKLDEAISAKSLLYIRYVDDIFIAIRNLHENRIKSQLSYWLKKLELEVSKEKTKWVPIKTEIDYLV
jgi:retron-type reverse transcriptase